MALQIVIPGTFTTPGLPDLGKLGFSDTFSRPNADTLGYTEEPRRPWGALPGSSPSVQVIRAGQAGIAQESGSGHCTVGADAGTPDGTLECTISTIGVASSQQGLMFRGTSYNSFWRFARNSIAQYELRKHVDGAVTTLHVTTGITPSEGDVLRVVLDGPSISCFINGQHIHDASDDFNVDATIHGFYNNATTDNRFDNVSFTA